MIKYFLLYFFFVSSVFAGTCTTTSRTNYTTGQVLTSTALNADLNQLVTKVNSLDGGCLTDSTVESTAFDSSLDALKNGIHQGCPLSATSASTISVGKCILSINGNFVKTTTSNTVTWGCTSCSAEATGSLYYVYAKPTSTGTTLNLLISTTEPGADGLDATNGKVLGRFYNDASGDIASGAVESWVTSRYENSNSFSFTFDYYGANPTTKCSTPSSYCTVKNFGAIGVRVYRSASTGVYNLALSKSVTSLSCTGVANEAIGTPAHFSWYYQPGPVTSVEFATYTSTSAYAVADTFGAITCKGFY